MKKSGIDVINILKYTMTLTIFIYVVFLVIAQGADAPMEQVAENVLGMVETDGMEEAGAQDFKRYYGLNAGDYEDVALYLPDDVMGVKELLLVKVKDKSQIETVRSAARRIRA